MKEILLGKSIVRVDDEDYESLSQWKWHVLKNGAGNTYAQRTDGKLMHRLLMHAGTGQLIDHADGDGLNNQKTNLRFATAMETMRNKRRISAASHYKGVQWDAERKKWRASIVIGGKKKRLGRFASAGAAGKAYDKASREYFGRFAATNAEIRDS